MQGIHHRVIEVRPQQNEYIESVWVVLKPNAGQVHLAQGQREAERFANGLICWKRKKIGWSWYLAIATVVIVAGVLVWLL